MKERKKLLSSIQLGWISQKNHHCKGVNQPEAQSGQKDRVDRGTEGTEWTEGQRDRVDRGTEGTEQHSKEEGPEATRLEFCPLIISQDSFLRREL